MLDDLKLICQTKTTLREFKVSGKSWKIGFIFQSGHDAGFLCELLVISRQTLPEKKNQKLKNREENNCESRIDRQVDPADMLR